MRIIAGKYRHRIIQMTNLETTRETQDKVRGAIFNMIGPYFDQESVLDLFAGSGAMGIEALSRGASHATFNDLVPKAVEVCKKNCEDLGIHNASFYTLDYMEFLEQAKQKWDLIFLDPPYAMNDVSSLLMMVLPYVCEEGKIIFEMAKESNFPYELDSLILKKERCYGVKRVAIYERRGGKYEL